MGGTDILGKEGTIMRDHSNHIELSREEAVATMLAHCAFAPGVEEVPLEQAFGRTLAENALALVTMPNCLTCNMDSIALRWSDFEQAEGSMPDISGWTRGVEWQFANTGVGMPEGFDTAIAIENAVVSADNTTLEQIVLPPSRRFAGTSPAGSRMREGDLVATAGTLVTPPIAAALAAAGHTSVRVVARPRVAFIPTGNELVPAGVEVPRGKNIESNSVVVRGKVLAWGGEPAVLPIVPDDPVQIEAAIHRACAEADIVVLNAGSSKGSDDWTMELLERIGRVFNHETNHGPGHHSSYALVDGTPIVGISGPSFGAAFTTDFYLKPLIDVWYGRSPEPKRTFARLVAEFPAGGPGGKPGTGMETGAGAGNRDGKPASAQAGGEERPRIERDAPFYAIQFVRLGESADGTLEATPIAARGSLVALDGCDAYYPLDRRRPPRVGDVIEVELRG